MASSILIKHPDSGLMKKGYYGFSWTYLFFGFFVPLFRGELGVAALHFLFNVVTLGLWQLIVSFLYNRQYMTRMLTSGWVLGDSPERNEFARTSLNIASQPAIDVDTNKPD